jgi:hypothetical protein
MNITVEISLVQNPSHRLLDGIANVGDDRDLPTGNPE